MKWCVQKFCFEGGSLQSYRVALSRSKHQISANSLWCAETRNILIFRLRLAHTTKESTTCDLVIASLFTKSMTEENVAIVLFASLVRKVNIVINNNNTVINIVD